MPCILEDSLTLGMWALYLYGKLAWLTMALVHLGTGLTSLSLEKCRLPVFLQSAEEERQCMSLSASCQQLPEGIQPVEHLDGSQGACRSA